MLKSSYSLFYFLYFVFFLPPSEVVLTHFSSLSLFFLWRRLESPQRVRVVVAVSPQPLVGFVRRFLLPRVLPRYLKWSFSLHGNHRAFNSKTSYYVCFRKRKVSPCLQYIHVLWTFPHSSRVLGLFTQFQCLLTFFSLSRSEKTSPQVANSIHFYLLNAVHDWSTCQCHSTQRPSSASQSHLFPITPQLKPKGAAHSKRKRRELLACREAH